ncbi:MAG: hypothetical protein ACM3MK_06440 [Chitinophagales bacterium]
MDPVESCHSHTMENIEFLVLRLRPSSSWNDYLEWLRQKEIEAGIFSEWILGQVTVLIAFEQPWEEMLNQAKTLTNQSNIIEFQMKGGRLARLNWRWPGGKAYYLCVLDKAAAADSRLLSFGLPYIEAQLIKLQMISDLYQERKTTITAEKDELEQRLANILHANLVPEQSRNIQADSLEQELQDLSTSYGILAGNYRIIREGYNRVNDRLTKVRQKLMTITGLTLTPSSLGIILGYYEKRLNDLKNLAEDLQGAMENFRAAIEVVRSRIEILISRENLVLQEGIKVVLETNTSIQKQSLTFQVAASLIEFIVLAYYSLSLWKYLAPEAYHRVPGWETFLLISSFSGIVVYCTHLIAERIQGEKHVTFKLVIAIFLLLMIFVFILYLSGLSGHVSFDFLKLK